MPKFPFFLLLSLLYATNSICAEIPSTGLVHNTKEMSAISYSCVPNGGVLKCEFNQTSVRKSAKPEELASKLEQAGQEFEKQAPEKVIDSETCNTTKILLDIVEGRMKAPKEGAVENMSEIEKKDLTTMSKAIQEFCGNRTKGNFLNFVKLEHEKNTRTCRASSNSFRATFKEIQDYVSDKNSWVVQSTPEGPCGVVQLSRFVPEKLEASKIVMWKYIAKKVITNPQGEILPGFSCSGLDQEEYVYDWRSQNHSPGCDYIEFSPL